MKTDVTWWTLHFKSLLISICVPISMLFATTNSTHCRKAGPLCTVCTADEQTDSNLPVPPVLSTCSIWRATPLAPCKSCHLWRDGAPAVSNVYATVSEHLLASSHAPYMTVAVSVLKSRKSSLMTRSLKNIVWALQMKPQKWFWSKRSTGSYRSRGVIASLNEVVGRLESIAGDSREGLLHLQWIFSNLKPDVRATGRRDFGLELWSTTVRSFL